MFISDIHITYEHAEFAFMTAHLIALTGRGVLAMLFILAGVTKLTAPKPVLAHMAQEHVPGVLLPVVALFEIAAGGALLIGWMTMLAAAALCVFCVATAIVFHRNFAERAERTSFAKDLALAGALAFIAAGAVP
jgi:putative oxidoreductase